MRKITKLLALLCTGVLLLGGCSPASSSESSAPPQSTSALQSTQAQEPKTTAPAPSRDVTVDFVVVGAGAGGLQAATEAAALGKSVVLLEKKRGQAALPRSAKASSGLPAQS